MLIEKIDLAAIDLADERFRISEMLESHALEQSLAEIGQLNPVILGGGKALYPVTGFRRLRALHRIGSRHVLVRQLPEALEPVEAFRIAIWENLAHRQLAPLEQARTLHILKHVCGVPHDELVQRYLPLLELAPHKNVLRSFLGLHSLVPSLRALFSQTRLTPASAEHLSTLPADQQERLAPLLDRIRLSASLQRQVFDIADELAFQRGCTAADVLCQPEITAIAHDARLSAFERGERVRQLLHQWRNPRLSRAVENFLSEKKKLGLPGIVRLSPEPFFETPRLRVEFDVTSADRFREVTAALHQAAQAPSLDALFKVS
jgi:hypothetical protein